MKVSVYIAVSMDGFIARENGDLDWLPGIEGFAGESEYEEDYGYNAFIESVDVIVMGRSTFEKVMHFDPWPYKNKRLIVLSSSLSTIPGNVPDTVELLNKTPEKILELLEHQKVKHVYLDGGRTIQSFLNAGLVDELIVTRIPVLIGQGIPLFGRLKKDIQLQHFETAAYKNGLVQSCYHVKNQD
ncbi:MAG: dihydrofolate reductase [Calditrichaeota bacterium]|nr:dihydrofolate reductase [Calditrichota bacterium]